jgi:hypothetical protein
VLKKTGSKKEANPQRQRKDVFLDEERVEEYKKRMPARLLSRLDRREAEVSAGLGRRGVFDSTWDLHPRGVRYVCMIGIAYQEALFVCPLPAGRDGFRKNEKKYRAASDEGSVPY